MNLIGILCVAVSSYLCRKYKWILSILSLCRRRVERFEMGSLRNVWHWVFEGADEVTPDQEMLHHVVLHAGLVLVVELGVDLMVPFGGERQSQSRIYLFLIFARTCIVLVRNLLRICQICFWYFLHPNIRPRRFRLKLMLDGLFHRG